MNVSTVTVNTDVLVAGGGLSGVCCAVAAARAGARVVLLQDRPVLGGNASSEIRMHVVGADGHMTRSKELEVEAREGGLIEEIRLETAVRNPQRCAEMFDLVLLEICRAEPNLQLFLNTTLTDVEMEGARIKKARAVRESTEDHLDISASVFVDCTGDGRLGMEAGATFRRGREASFEYGESLAGEKADPWSLGSSLLYTARKHDNPIPFKAPAGARKFDKEFLRMRSPRSSADPVTGENTYEYGHWWFEWGGKIDTIKDNELIRDELLSILMGAWDYVKNSGECANSENWALDWFGFVPGKRESRRFIGQHILTQNDFENSVRFDDAIAYGGWAMDLHPPGGVDAPDERPCRQFGLKVVYDIPLRACVSVNVENLMFAGRNISATHVAFSSTRVMATCAAMGQGVGVAAAVAVKNSVAPAALYEKKDLLKDIQQILLREDAYLIGIKNDDARDLARQATITASSIAPGAEADQVVSGQTRAIHGEDGAPADRAFPGLHRWMSDSSAELPAWIEFRWDAPVAIGNVRVIFDTGLHRELTLSHSGSCNRRMVWGPQPESVKDYDLEIWLDGAWQVVESVRDNYFRLRHHQLPTPQTTDRLRIKVLATNGAAEARICEVRIS